MSDPWDRNAIIWPRHDLRDHTGVPGIGKDESTLSSIQQQINYGALDTGTEDGVTTLTWQAPNREVGSNLVRVNDQTLQVFVAGIYIISYSLELALIDVGKPVMSLLVDPYPTVRSKAMQIGADTTSAKDTIVFSDWLDVGTQISARASCISEDATPVQVAANIAYALLAVNQLT